MFLAVLEGDRGLVESLDEAVRAPHFPLYLGRRSCPPQGPVALGISDHDLDTALSIWRWLASPRVQSRHRECSVQLAVVRDAAPDEPGAESLRDTPVSFDPNRREHAWRSIVRDTVEIPNAHGVVDPAAEHDPMAILGG